MTGGAVFERVAVIDDSSVDRRLALRVLRRSPLVGEAFGFCNGAEALAWFAAGRCRRMDVILLDIRMPRMDGFAFLDALRRETTRPAPVDVVAILTTSLDPRDRARAARYEEIRAYIDKPLGDHHLRDLAQAWGDAGGRAQGRAPDSRLCGDACAARRTGGDS